MTPTYILLYVDKPEASGTFYAELFGRKAVESSPTFVLFVFENGLKFGLWSKHGVQPPASGAAGSAEVAITVDADALEATFHAWTAKGITIAQPVTELDFGRTFVALDPDGHRIRVFTPVG
ncbi:hypothetical protein SAMN02745157_4649 [Kaistia soli DSM 19436]|uniref:VOC domain-containing protein n=1 Tax=Kaistia soli DSM 19436 TaxID=1122133 RepID=A0A1M5LNX5_9HYPH|nr:VOC family protein [Kaistia soli]SHG66656.1 hypothetical protein SAMN02745157_4649 [Kaistia soli DSM 19436]